jgi:hypothetical protein
VEQETSQPSLPAIQGMSFLAPPVAGQTLTMLKALPASLTDDQFNQVKAIAKAPLPSPKLVTNENFGKAITLLETSLKRRKDEVTSKDDAEMRMRVYRKCLSHLSHPQLWWTVEQAVARLTFFPTVKELLDISEGWIRRDDATEAQRLAKLLANREANRRHIASTRKAPARPLTQAEIDAMSPELRKLGLSLGYLVECDGKVIAAPETEETEQ